MVWPNALACHFQAQVIQARERAQVGAIKGSIGHVEVFQMDGVGISIIGRPRPLPGHDTPNPAHNTYTLKSEEPVIPAHPGLPHRHGPFHGAHVGGQFLGGELCSPISVQHDPYGGSRHGW